MKKDGTTRPASPRCRVKVLSTYMVRRNMPSQTYIIPVECKISPSFSFNGNIKVQYVISHSTAASWQMLSRIICGMCTAALLSTVQLAPKEMSQYCICCRYFQKKWLDTTMSEEDIKSYKWRMIAVPNKGDEESNSWLEQTTPKNIEIGYLRVCRTLDTDEIACALNKLVTGTWQLMKCSFKHTRN